MSKKQGKPTIKAKQKKDYTFIFSAVILILAIAQYLNTLGHDYAWDDAIVIRDNVYTQEGLGSLKDIWTKPVYIPQRDIYRPIPQTTFALEKHFFPEGNPKVGHLLNILFYAFCSLLLFHFFKRLLPQYHLIFAFLASLLFVVHPIHTEVVANIKSRDEILALSFGLASMIFFLSFLSKKKNIFLLPVFLFFIMACLSKLNAITLLAIYPILYFFNPKIVNKKLGTYSFFTRDTQQTEGEKPFLPIPILYKGIIALGVLAAAAAAIYSNNPLITLVYILILGAVVLMNFKKIQPWDFTFLISVLLIVSFFFKLNDTTVALFILFLIYSFERKHWNIKYFIPVAILLLPQIYQQPIIFILIFAIHLALQQKIGKWFKLLLISHPMALAAMFYNANYIGIILLVFSTIYCFTVQYKSTHKIFPILSILLFIGLASFEITYDSPVNMDNSIATNNAGNKDNVKSFQLSKVNNSLINEPDGIKHPTIAKVQLEYLKKSFFPHPLIHNYGYNVISNITWKSPIAWISILIHFLLLLYVLKKIQEKDPIAFGILFYFITLSIYSNIILLAPDTMAERFLFFPSLGFSVGFIFLWAGITKVNLHKKPTANTQNMLFYGGIALVLVLGFYKTMERNKDWKDNKTLATNTISQAPNSALIHANFAGEWMHHYEVVSNSTDQQALNDAIRAAEKAVEIHPNYFNAMMDLGMMYLKSGDVAKAKDTFKSCLEINPKHTVPNLNLGLIYYAEKQYAEGIATLETIRTKILLDEENISLDAAGLQQMYLFLGRCYFNNNQLDKATLILEEASQRSPTNPYYFELLANMYANKNDLNSAVSYLEKANRIAPDNQNIAAKLAEWKGNL